MPSTARRIPKQEWKRHEETIHNLYHVQDLSLKAVQQVMRDNHQFSASAAQYETYFKQHGTSKNAKKEEWTAIHVKLRKLDAANVQYRVRFLGQLLTKERVARSRRHVCASVQEFNTGSDNEHPLTTSPHRLTIEVLNPATTEWTAYKDDGNSQDHESPVLNNDGIAVELVEPPADETSRDMPSDGHNLASPSPSLLINNYSAQEVQHSPGLATLSEEFLFHQENMPFPPLPLENSQGAFHDNSSLAIDSPDRALQLFWHGPSIERDEIAQLNPPSLLLSHSLPSSSIRMDLPWYCGMDPSVRSWQPAMGFNSNPNESRFEYWNLMHDTPFCQLMKSIPAKSRTPPHYHQYALDGRTANQSIVSQVPSKILVRSLLRDAAEVLATNSIPGADKLPDPDSLLESLLSLLPDPFLQIGSGQTGDSGSKDVISESPFYRALLFSIANGFAGLQDMPAGAIIGMLKHQPQIRVGFFECIGSCPPALAKPLADNLFRAAVESLDENAVTSILNITTGSLYAIDPNLIACKVYGNDRLYTPVELAAKFRHFGIVQALLAADADVNKTYLRIDDIEVDGYNDQGERGALELAIRKTGVYEAVDMGLVRALLDSHALVRASLVNVVVRWGAVELAQQLILRFPRGRHHAFFGLVKLHDGGLKRPHRRNLLKHIARLQHDIAAQIMGHILEFCRSENCNQCPKVAQGPLEDALYEATARANVQVTDLLLPYASDDFSALSAAIKSGSRTLIELMLQRGLGVGEKARDLHLKGFDCTPPPTTPLAEAIRTYNKDLVNTLEERGALSFLHSDRHFEAAVFAAAEIGDHQYLEKLLALKPRRRGSELTAALGVAISNEDTKLAIAIIDAGANVNSLCRHRCINYCMSPLQEAIRRRNRVIVDKILGADFNPGINFLPDPALFLLDGELIKIIILVGLNTMERYVTERVDTLAAAVKARNADIVTLLLENGAMTRSFDDHHPSALQIACENNDEAMIRLLLSYEASPLDPNTLFWAKKNNRRTFEILLEAIAASRSDRLTKCEYPILLIKAMEEKAYELIDTLLAVKTNLNLFTTYSPRGNGKRISITALGFAIRHQNGSETELAQKLINAGGDSNSIVQMNIAARGDTVWPQHTALLVAIETKSKAMVKLLLDNGADINRPAQRGIKRTPLQRACETGSYAITELLLDRGAKVDEPPADRGGGTALQLAAISGSIKIVQLLLSHGASITAAPSKVNGRTAFEGAAEHGRLDMLKVLWDATSGRFSPQEVQRAMALAEERGHTSCAEYIGNLSATSAVSLLEANHGDQLDGIWGIL